MTERTKRLDELLREEISKVVAREIADPRVGFVTITSVEVAPDLRHATVWASVIGSAVTLLTTGTRASAHASASNATGIDAPPDRVWPWIAQLGQGRGGFYTYARLENLAAATPDVTWSKDLAAGDGG